MDGEIKLAFGAATRETKAVFNRLIIIIIMKCSHNGVNTNECNVVKMELKIIQMNVLYTKLTQTLTIERHNKFQQNIQQWRDPTKE